jgi:hypothetical protein
MPSIIYQIHGTYSAQAEQAQTQKWFRPSLEIALSPQVTVFATAIPAFQ